MKSIFVSKTFWLAVLTAGIGLVNEVKDMFTPEQVNYALVIIGGIASILRFNTDTPVSVTGK